MKTTRLALKAILLLVLACLCAPCPAQSYDVPIASITCKGLPVPLLNDGDTGDRSAWSVFMVGTPQIVFTLARQETLVGMRIYPGTRQFARNPSTEGGPKEIRLYGRLKDGEWKPLLPQAVALPRDDSHQPTFFVDIPFPAVTVDAVRLDILATHDPGLRMSTDKVAPMEERVATIREVGFMSNGAADAQTRERQERREGIAAFLARYDSVTAQADNPLGQAIRACWGSRMEELRALVQDGGDEKAIEANARYLQEQVTPYLEANFEDSHADRLRLTVRVSGGADESGVPVEFPLHFALLEQACGDTLSRFAVTVSAVHGNDITAIPSALVPLTPDRSRLCWTLAPNAEAYFIDIPRGPEATAKPLALNRLVGNGDQLPTASVARHSGPWMTWNVHFVDIFNEGKDALMLGQWTDFIHIFRNLGTPQEPKYHEAAHYLARDPFDNPVCATFHQDHAYSLAYAADVDGDDKLDLFIQHHRTAPRFLHNRSAKKGGLDYASPVTTATLDKEKRYEYADLDGDGLADAVGVILDGARVVLTFHKGRGMSEKGEALFAEAVPLDPGLPDSTEASRGEDARPNVALRDLNHDGLVDLTVAIPPFFYVCLNNGTPQNFSFGAPQQLVHASGQPVRTPFYYPNVGWGDINGDGLPDLFQRNIGQCFMGRKDFPVFGDLRGIALVEKQLAVSDHYYSLCGFSLADIDKDGYLEFLQIHYPMLSRFKYVDGLFKPMEKVQLGRPDAQRFGCPDTNEYGSLYTQQCAYDFDGNGELDFLINDEHNWRMGYFSLFLNKGDCTFGEELQVTPMPNDAHLKYTHGGTALHVTPETALNYLAVKTEGLLEAAGGAIDFEFAADEDTVPPVGRTLFSSAFANFKRHQPRDIYESYRRCKTMEQFLSEQPCFALLQLPDGRLRCQLGEAALVSNEPISLRKNEMHKFSVQWGPKGTQVLLDGRTVLSGEAVPSSLADFFHLGSMAWMAVQHFREYPNRRASNSPVDFSTPACGSFASLKFTAADGHVTGEWQLGQGCPLFAERSRLLYRCAPAVTEDFNGKTALLALMDDNLRVPSSAGEKTRLYAIPFTRRLGQAPLFEAPVPLDLTDGRPFYGRVRTVITPCDWNGDGATDLILSTSNSNNSLYVGVELFLNDGNWRFTRTTDKEFIRLNKLLDAHHDIKVALAPLTGAALPDIVAWTDPGLRVYSRAFLQEKSAAFTLESIK